jgi:hypothetical protein
VSIVQIYLHRLTSAWQMKQMKSDVGVMMDSKDEMFISILKKLYGAYDASHYLAESCEVCHETLVPFDIGVDPYTDTRTWMTKCCGVVNTYNQKLAPQI